MVAEPNPTCQPGVHACRTQAGLFTTVESRAGIEKNSDIGLRRRDSPGSPSASDNFEATIIQFCVACEAEATPSDIHDSSLFAQKLNGRTKSTEGSRRLEAIEEKFESARGRADRRARRPGVIEKCARRPPEFPPRGAGSAFANVSAEGRSEISRSDSGGSGPAGDLANGPRISLSRAAPIYLSRFATQPAATAGFEIEKARLQHRLSAPRGCKFLPI